MQIRFKKMHPMAKAPTQGTAGAAGYDLMAVDYSKEKEVDAWSYRTGIAVEIPAGYVGLITPRSSIYRTGSMLCNSVGVIDSDYRGEITAKFTGSTKPYNVGERICQLLIVPVEVVEFTRVDELSETERGTGGYGSTGK